MNVKTTITLPEHYLQYAEKMVEEGVYPSVSSVIEAGLEKMMRHGEPSDPLAGMADEIRHRMELPRDQWLPWDGSAMADRVKAKLREKHGK
jgi:antitoxin ParD1/3/4